MPPPKIDGCRASEPAAHLADVEEELLEKLWRTFRSPDYRAPVLPAVAVQLMQLAQDPGTTFRQVSDLLERDAFLAGHVLRTARSPLYAGRAEVASIEQALSRLGLQTLRDIVLQVALTSRVFRAKPYQPLMEALSRHTTAAAHVAKTIASATNVEAQAAFMCGLLHDVGVAGVLIAVSEQSGRTAPPKLEAIWPAIDTIHADVSRVMADRWGLPVEVSTAIGAHHEVLVDGRPDSMAAVLHLTEHVTDHLGMSLFPSAADEPEVDMPLRVDSSPNGASAMQALGLGPADVETIVASARLRLDAVGLT